MTPILNNITFGSDIEAFLYDSNLNKLVSAVGIVPGTKEEPIALSEEGYAIERDNVSLEYLIKPCSTIKELFINVDVGAQLCKKVIPTNFMLDFRASHLFPEEELNCQEAQEFGCDPDINAWTKKENPRPKANKTNLRTNGFHIHIGYEFPSTSTNYELVKALDLFLGLPSIEADKDAVRRELYGKAGSCRHKPYGVEYRVLSSYMTEYRNIVEEGIQNAIDFINAGKTVSDEDGKIIQSCINSSKLTDKGKNLIKQLITT